MKSRKTFGPHAVNAILGKESHVLVNHEEKLVRTPFENEAEIEGLVQDFAEDLFGPNIIYLPQTRITTIGGRGSIPDAIVLDVESQEWYIVEAERAVHGTWEHIAPQVSRQLAAVASSDTRELILRLALEQVSQNQTVKQVFSELGIEELDIHGRLQRLLRKPPIIAIPIDAIPKDLKEWVQTLRNDVKIWVLEKYVGDRSSDRIFYSLPDETFPTLSTRTTKSGGVATVTRGSAPWQDLISSGMLKEGDALVMDYGPRGQPRRTFHGVARNDGVEIDGRVLSPSAAAVHRIREAGSDRRTANGWTIWKTPQGKYLFDLYEELGSSNNGDTDPGEDIEEGGGLDAP